MQILTKGVEDAEALKLLRQFGRHAAPVFWFVWPMELQSLADYVLHPVHVAPDFENRGT